MIFFKEGVKSDVVRNRVLAMQVLNALADDPSADDNLAPQLKDWLLLCRYKFCQLMKHLEAFLRT